MQHRSENTAARDLPAVWGAFLVGHLQTDLTMLNRTLVNAPNGRPFKWLENPTPQAPRGVRDVFGRVVNEGHWPDNRNYREYWADNAKYNLFERVGQHLPESADWLFRDLLRIAQELPLHQFMIQDAIVRSLDRFGLARLRPPAAFVVIQLIWNSTPADLAPHLVRNLFAPALERLARMGEPVHVNLLTLLWAEERCLRSEALGPELKQYCLEGWTHLLRRPEIQYDRVLARASVRAVRGLLASLGTARIVSPMPFPSSLGQTMVPICPIYRPTPERIAAELTLCHCYWDNLLDRHDERRASPFMIVKKKLAPDDVEQAFRVVIEGIRAAEDCWRDWQRFGASELETRALTA